MKRRLKRIIAKKLKAEQAELRAVASSGTLTRPEIANNIKKTVGIYYRKKHRAVFPELGLKAGGALRADLFVLAMNGYAVVVEVKSSVSDFRTDSKMTKYLKYANQAYVATTHKVYKKIEDDIDPRFGVFVLTDDGLYIKKVYRAKKRELDPDIVFNLAMRAVFRSMENNGRKNKALI